MSILGTMLTWAPAQSLGEHHPISHEFWPGSAICTKRAVSKRAKLQKALMAALASIFQTKVCKVW